VGGASRIVRERLSWHWRFARTLMKVVTLRVFGADFGLQAAERLAANVHYTLLHL
jgi:hypothetical protein